MVFNMRIWRGEGELVALSDVMEDTQAGSSARQRSSRGKTWDILSCVKSGRQRVDMGGEVEGAVPEHLHCIDTNLQTFQSPVHGQTLVMFVQRLEVGRIAWQCSIQFTF